MGSFRSLAHYLPGAVELAFGGGLVTHEKGEGFAVLDALFHSEDDAEVAMPAALVVVDLEGPEQREVS